MNRQLITVVTHILIYCVTPFWWSSFALSLLFGFLFHKGIPFWLQTALVMALCCIDATYIYIVNDGRLANQLIQVFGLEFGPFLILFSTLCLGIGVGLSEWLGRNLRSVFRPIRETK